MSADEFQVKVIIATTIVIGIFVVFFAGKGLERIKVGRKNFSLLDIAAILIITSIVVMILYEYMRR